MDNLGRHTYTGRLPKCMEKFRGRIADIYCEGRDGWWVDYKPGWCSGVLGAPDLGHSPALCVHMDHEYSKTELWKAVRRSTHCDCKNCDSQQLRIHKKRGENE